MAFDQSRFAPVSGRTSDTPAIYNYSTPDTAAAILAPNYFAEKRFQLMEFDLIHASCDDGVRLFSVTADLSTVVFPNDILGGGGAVSLSTDQQYFDKNNSVAATPEQIAGDVRVQNYSVSNDTGVTSQILVPGANYSLMTDFLEANEATRGVKPDYFNIAGAPQATYLSEANDNYLFPSNIFTYNNLYVNFNFRVIVTIDHPALGSNQSTTLSIRLRRTIDDSIISSKEENLSNKAARTGFKFTREFHTFVNSETDPFVLDGMYIDILNESDSDTNATVVSANIRLFKF